MTTLPFTRSDLHILAVDDDPIQLKLVSEMLIHLGYRVTCANNGQEATNLLTEGNVFDLILSDVMMPVMDGPQFLQVTRSNHKFAEIPIVMMSSNDQYEIVFDCLSKGADDYIIKPLTPQVLKNIYANVWLKRKQNEAVAKVQHQIVEANVIQKRNEEMKKSYYDTVKTPLHIIAASLESIVSDENISNESKSIIIDSIAKLKEFNSSGCIPSSGPNIPERMKDIFQHQFGVGQSKKVVSPIAIKPVIKSKLPAPPPTIPSLPSLNLGLSVFSFDFNAWSFQESLLMNLANDLFSAMTINSLLSTKVGEMEQFIQRSMKSHRTNPFHNFRRSVECLQLATSILHRVQRSYDPSEVAGGLFAAFLHDIDHPGTNNMFQSRTSSQLALVYNDKSILESNSASVGARIIQEVFSFTLEAPEFIILRQTFLKCVLKTDYSKLQKFLSKAASIDINWENKKHRLMSLQLLTLMSDLSYSVRKWETAGYWYGLMRDEQFLQGDMERRKQMKIAGLMDRKSGISTTEFMKTHFTVFVIPVFQTGFRFFPELEPELMPIIQKNFDIINEMQAVELSQSNQ